MGEEFKDGTVYVDGRMLVGQDLFNWVFDRERERREMEQAYDWEAYVRNKELKRDSVRK